MICVSYLGSSDSAYEPILITVGLTVQKMAPPVYYKHYLVHNVPEGSTLFDVMNMAYKLGFM